MYQRYFSFHAVFGTVGGVLLITALLVDALRETTPCYCVWALVAAGVAAFSVSLLFYKKILWEIQRRGLISRRQARLTLGTYLLVVPVLLCMMGFKAEAPWIAIGYLGLTILAGSERVNRHLKSYCGILDGRQEQGTDH